MSIIKAFAYVALLIQVAVAMPGAMPWMGPMPTPMGLMASNGISPRPTDAPGSKGMPMELRRRKNNVLYPPPLNWCGFIEGDYSNPLSCSADLTCINSLDAVGCCTATTGICTALYTTCANYGDLCDAACQLDPAIRKCDVLEPYCGTYRFPGGTYLYNCGVTSDLPYTMEFLNDYYVTRIGSTLASETTDPFGFVASATQAAASGASLTSTPTHSISSSSNDDSDSSGGLSNTAIDGIAAAGAIVGIAILGIIIFFCVRQRKRRRLAAASTPYANAQYPPPPMQQQPPQQAQAIPPKAFDGYQTVPQQEQQPPYSKYPSPPPQPQQQQSTGYFPPPGAPSTITPAPTSPNPTTDPRFSTAAPSLLSPSSDAPSGDPHHSVYKPPISPTVTEVDGTMGNPGTPNQNTAQHSRPLEVDGTMGNPGVPQGGHGIQNQMQPGGSPSAQEIDGRVGANMNRPFAMDGPYELGHEGQAR
ncbi:hypothetical protein ACLMJK_001630 [Lecanora helva]